MTKISALAAVTALTSTDELVLAQAGTTKKIDALYLPGFKIAYVEFTSSVTITAASTAASPIDVVSAGAIAFDGSTSVCIEFYAPAMTATGAGQQIVVTLWDATTDLGRIVQSGNIAGIHVFPCGGKRYLTPSAATHTYKIRAFTDGAANADSVQAGLGGVDTQMPGFIRITAA